MSVLLALLAACFCMMCSDVLGVGITISQARALIFWPGFFDALGDYANKYGAAIVAVTSVHYGLWSFTTFVVVTACAITSFFTSNLATGKESKLLPMSRAEQLSLNALAQRFHSLFHKSTTKEQP